MNGKRYKVKRRINLLNEKKIFVGNNHWEIPKDRKLLHLP